MKNTIPFEIFTPAKIVKHLLTVAIATIKAYCDKYTTETISVRCEYCGIDFTNKTIKKHIGASHPEKIDQTEKKEYKCTQCDEKFGASITLLKHEYVEHGILKHPNVCEHCNTPYNIIN